MRKTAAGDHCQRRCQEPESETQERVLEAMAMDRSINARRMVSGGEFKKCAATALVT